VTVPSFFAYWGKASAQGESGERFHLLPFHSLDVAACGQTLIKLPHFSLQPLARELGWPLSQVESLFVLFLALHDLGKFARSFQGLVTDLSPDLVPADRDKLYTKRHDTLGWMLWCEDFASESETAFLPDASHEFWGVWLRAVVGHHGKPPQEHESGGLIAFDASEHFLRSDRRAAHAFVDELASWLCPREIPPPERKQLVVLKRHAWRLAGLAVLADWLGSNQVHFPYRSGPTVLTDYWLHAQQQAREAVTSAGLEWHAIRHWPHPQQLFDYLTDPTPLQQYAATVELEGGPQLFLLEDVTGAGKTEAALILSQRLMQNGLAHGLYFALPSMATANQMYQRVGSIYRRLYAPGALPSLVLSHGARQLVEGYRQSVLHASDQPDDGRYKSDEGTASAQCNAWLADNRKKALLADVGVGTLDQALLAVLPARHQSLRLLGLAGKVLLVDEVHAYDPYMLSLLKNLLIAHARQCGSVILLSATLPLDVRNQLLQAYRSGLGCGDGEDLGDARYPLAVQAGQKLHSYACATRPQVRRKVQVSALHDEESVLALIAEQARAGRCIAWIRNTVSDARRAHALLTERMQASDVMLFHSRYAMGDRLDIENAVLARFGKHSSAAQRKGRVLVGTQVLEQSLDFDVDLMVSDLAPIDLVIQRAGRLQRHARQANGDPAADGVEQRAAPMLYLLTPEPVDEPKADWYASMFPKGCFVYPDAGKLWLGARALLAAGHLVTPGEAGQAGAVRELVEAVYGVDEQSVPEALQKSSRDQIGEGMAMQSQAHFNALKLDMGYCIDSSARWYEDNQVPTRLGDETQTLYLALWRDGELQPLCDSGLYCWERSAVNVRAEQARALAPDWQQRFGGAVERLRKGYRLLEEPAFVVPLAAEDGELVAKIHDARGRLVEMRYDRASGLSW